jgi:transcriptional regulator of met regulon
MRPGRCISVRRRTFSSELWCFAFVQLFRGLPLFLLSVIPDSGDVLKYQTVIMCTEVLRCCMIRLSALHL